MSDASFGFRKVPVEEKQGLVNRVFDTVASRYDVMNDAMSGGLHRVWKDAMVAWLAPPRQPRERYRVVDVAGGTGDIAFRIARRIEQNGTVTVCDINPEMLLVGAERNRRRLRPTTPCHFVAANAESMPLPDGSCDVYTIAFGIRNVTHRDVALKEAHRVLRRGGRFMCLEFSHVDIPGVDKIYDAYSFNMIPAMGKMIAGDGEPYRYLVESIRTFPNPGRFAAEIERAGFSHVAVRPLTGGVAALHSAFKL
ncbi:bifunctional demethylmenaquinone methyltransferase/2-methoxy-6-polyprenyl-1,4-benzoquinol methylase UbiE [Acuticoccus sp. M5D2P5]|uniref:bifunctional demethylmenaquinone methyltransferase/2-methoxy-6-polyprenyl-1,4-benzoquinol methylase UbiE n=1 Tax=Acuticoccus kalidii TaxID=2910977 RepID=UPI001F3B8935|nr:bifunctional demethylmenaquinone methyltransferase/2-methoxy-6-polyprenyl-1,4-benzoquinol methylase UbiE [Acuticoccus kalidii]MCF3935510.1 bifunctional demethylmenaquinone methyltransferase/2-methoxy-6-polyprenyl-1,4-benzoquinol methylase UbiE [Acuticoccus kalidii]